MHFMGQNWLLIQMILPLENIWPSNNDSSHYWLSNIYFFIIDNANYFCILLDRLEGVDVEVSQGVSQVSGLQIVPMSDDMLQLHMMMIEDIIESTDVSLLYFCAIILYILIIWRFIIVVICIWCFAVMCSGCCCNNLWYWGRTLVVLWGMYKVCWKGHNCCWLDVLWKV